MEILTQLEPEDFDCCFVNKVPRLEQECDISDATNINICVSGMCSYDKAYRKTAKNTKVNTYIVKYDDLDDFIKIIKGEKEIDNIEDNLPYKNLLRDLKKINGKNIMVYFECCSFFCSNDYKFPSETISLISYLIFEKKCFVLFSDFSLKALINCWNEEIFGLNPFIRYDDLKIGHVKIIFEKEKFKNSNLKQLQVISELVSTEEEIGNIYLKVLEETISFGIKEELLNTEFYNIQILSNTLEENDSHTHKKRKVNLKTKNTKNTENIEELYVGQAIINFKKRKDKDKDEDKNEDNDEEYGRILVSNGHFCELSGINYNEDSLISSIKSNLGQEYYEKVKDSLNTSCNQYNESLVEVVSEIMSQPLSQVE